MVIIIIIIIIFFNKRSQTQPVYNTTTYEQYAIGVEHVRLKTQSLWVKWQFTNGASIYRWKYADSQIQADTVRWL